MMKNIATLVKECRLEPGERPNLPRIPSDVKPIVAGDKSEGKKQLLKLSQQLADLQRKLYAQRQHRILVVLQGMDTSGKDGTIRHVFRLVNPNGVHVAPFNRPTPQELSYDYLRRVHARVPSNGEIVIFDRSHYEDIVTVRVNNLKPPTVWKKRYDHVNAFEQMLADEGTTIIKIFLHINMDTQKERLQARLDDPEKHWKFDASDLIARKRWSAYMKAYADAMERCNFAHAPWYIIPSNQKWVRNLLVAQILVNKLSSLKMEFPGSELDLSTVKIDE